jgi:hypothetical protein
VGTTDGFPCLIPSLIVYIAVANEVFLMAFATTAIPFIKIPGIEGNFLILLSLFSFFLFFVVRTPVQRAS